jgi:hypothetical protein
MYAPWDDSDLLNSEAVQAILALHDQVFARVGERWRAKSCEATTRTVIDVYLLGVMGQCSDVVLEGEEKMNEDGQRSSSATMDYVIGREGSGTTIRSDTKVPIEAKKKGALSQVGDSLRKIFAQFLAELQQVFVHGRVAEDHRVVMGALADGHILFVGYITGATGRLHLSPPLSNPRAIVAALLYVVREGTQPFTPEASTTTVVGGGGRGKGRGRSAGRGAGPGDGPSSGTKSGGGKPADKKGGGKSTSKSGGGIGKSVATRWIMPLTEHNVYNFAQT